MPNDKNLINMCPTKSFESEFAASARRIASVSNRGIWGFRRMSLHQLRLHAPSMPQHAHLISPMGGGGPSNSGQTRQKYEDELPVIALDSYLLPSDVKDPLELPPPGSRAQDEVDADILAMLARAA